MGMDTSPTPVLDSTKPAVLCDLGALVRENLLSQTAEIAAALERPESEIVPIVEREAAAYAEGRISQGDYWSDIAGSLLLDDLDVPAVYGERSAETEPTVLGAFRGYQTRIVSGLVSDATPDWVGLWRKTYALDKLFDVSVIGSEVAEKIEYVELLKLAASRVQREPRQITFVDYKSAHLQGAASLGMTTVDIGRENLASALEKLV